MLNTETLNWNDRELMQASLADLDPIQNNLYMYSRNQINQGHRYSGPAKYGNYGTNSHFFALCDWNAEKRKNYIMCKTFGPDGRPSYCNMWRWCDHCSWRTASKVRKRFVHSYVVPNHWYHITYSYKSAIDLTKHSQSDYLGKFQQGQTFFKNLSDNFTIDGAYVVNEVVVSSLSGNLVFPHVHALVNSSTPIPEDFKSICNIDESEVSLKVEEIQDYDHYLEVIKYPLKPVNLQAVYALEIAQGTSPIHVNRGMSNVLKTLSAWEFKKTKIQFYGNMSKRATKREFIGDRY